MFQNYDKEKVFASPNNTKAVYSGSHGVIRGGFTVFKLYVQLLRFLALHLLYFKVMSS